MLPGRRAVRVGDQVLKEIAAILMEKVRDPRVEGVTLTGIHLSNDLKQARVYFSAMGESDQISSAEAGLKSAKGFIKRQIGKRLSLRFIPDIRFVHDPSLQFGSHMEGVLSSLRDEEVGDTSDDA